MVNDIIDVIISKLKEDRGDVVVVGDIDISIFKSSHFKGEFKSYESQKKIHYKENTCYILPPDIDYHRVTGFLPRNPLIAIAFGDVLNPSTKSTQSDAFRKILRFGRKNVDCYIFNEDKWCEEVSIDRLWGLLDG